MFVGLGTVVRLIYTPATRKQLPAPLSRNRQLNIARPAVVRNLYRCRAMSSYVELCRPKRVSPRFVPWSVVFVLVSPTRPRTHGRLNGRLYGRLDVCKTEKPRQTLTLD